MPTTIQRACATALCCGLLLSGAPALAQKGRQLTDEDILNPKKLVFDRVVTFADSFDNAPIGTIFVSKRSILGHPEKGVLGEAGSPKHREACLFFCPMGTSDIDATYVYVIQKKGECTIGVRAIGWAEVEEEFRGGLLSGKTVETGRVRYTGQAINIKRIQINGRASGAPLNAKEISGPHGTNYRYFPRKKDLIGQQTTANEGFITDIHFFQAGNLKQAARSTSLTIAMPGWEPERHVISGKELEELRKLTDQCDSD